MEYIESGEKLLLVLEALSNPLRLKIISNLYSGRCYVSELARQLKISRALLYLHLKKLEEAELVDSEMEISSGGKAMKYYYLKQFDFKLNEDIIHNLVNPLSGLKDP